MTRSLQACPGCARQYDVGALSAHSRVDCTCGKTFSVEPLTPRAARAMCCSRCGGNLADGARTCAYCDARITIEERRLDSICPLCFARMSADARFCMTCGVRIEPQVLKPLARQRACPRCNVLLRSREVGKLALVECDGCGGIWIDPALLQRLCDDAGARKSVGEALGERPTRQTPKGATAGPVYVRCPECGTLMNRKMFSGISGILIDVCKGHGVWMDHGELAGALRFVEGGGMVEARRREVNELEQRKRQAELAGSGMGLGGSDPADLGMPWGSGRASTSAAGLLRWLLNALIGV